MPDFSRFAETTHTFAPTTFSKYKDPTSELTTFIKGKADTVSDYVMVSHGVKVQEHSGEVLTSFNMMHLEDGDDHRPIAIMIQVPAKPHTAVKKRKVTRYDRSKIGDLDCDAKFQAVVQALCPCIPYNVDSHSHVYVVTSFIIAALEWAYPKKA